MGSTVSLETGEGRAIHSGFEAESRSVFGVNGSRPGRRPDWKAGERHAAIAQPAEELRAILRHGLRPGHAQGGAGLITARVVDVGGFGVAGGRIDSGHDKRRWRSRSPCDPQFAQHSYGWRTA
jgi:hypothetical protein